MPGCWCAEEQRGTVDSRRWTGTTLAPVFPVSCHLHPEFRMTSVRIRALALLSVVLAACSSTSNNNTTAGFHARIGGSPWTGLQLSTTSQISQNAIFTISGGDASGTSLSLTLYYITQPGT